jgi:DNA repair exonuclease SbcCD ATPase subunit
MENEGRIVELLAESLKRQDNIIEQLKESNQKLYVLESKSDRVEEQLIKLNLQTAENTRALIKLSENIDQISDLNNRVSKLEKAVFK